MIGSSVVLLMVLAADAGPGGASPDAGPPDAAAARDAGQIPDAGAPDTLAPLSPIPPAPAGRLTGRVLARGTRAPIVGASLATQAGPLGDTDARGNFDVAIACGRRPVTVHALGFEQLVLALDGCAAPALPLTLRLTPNGSGATHETVVRARPTQPAVRLVKEELTQTPGSMGNPFRALESLPGVVTVAWPAPIYAVRGSNPGNTGFFLDNVRVPALFHLALGPSVIHPYFFDDLQFYPGGYPARFGRYVAGIVTADTRPAATDRPHVSVDARLYDAGALVSAPLPGNGGVAAAARYSYTGELVSLLNQSIQLAYWDYQLRVDRRVGPVQLTLLAFGSHDKLVPGALPTDKADEADIDFHRVSLRASLPVAGGHLQGSVAVGSGSHARADPGRLSDHGRRPQRGAAPLVRAIVRVRRRVRRIRRRRHPLRAADHRNRPAPGHVGSRPAAGGRPAGRPRVGHDPARTGVSRSPPSSGSTATPSRARERTTLARGWPCASPCATTPQSRWRAVGSPSCPVCLCRIPGADGFGLGTLGLQSSWQGSAGVETSAVSGIDLSATGYLHHYWLTDLRDATPSRPDPLADDFLINREAVSYGLELLVRRPLSNRLYGWLSYTLSNNLRSFGGGAYGPSDWDQRHVFNLVVGYRWGDTPWAAALTSTAGDPICFTTAAPPFPSFRCSGCRPSTRSICVSITRSSTTGTSSTSTPSWSTPP